MILPFIRMLLLVHQQKNLQIIKFVIILSSYNSVSYIVATQYIHYGFLKNSTQFSQGNIIKYEKTVPPSVPLGTFFPILLDLLYAFVWLQFFSIYTTNMVSYHVHEAYHFFMVFYQSGHHFFEFTQFIQSIICLFSQTACLK